MLKCNLSVLNLLKKCAPKLKPLCKAQSFFIWSDVDWWSEFSRGQVPTSPSIPHPSQFYILGAFVDYLSRIYIYIFWVKPQKYVLFTTHLPLFPRACNFCKQIFGLWTCRKVFPVTRAHIKEPRRVSVDIKQRDLPTVLESLLIFQALKLITQSFGPYSL